MTAPDNDVIAEVLKADGASFTALVKIANLKPAKDFRHCNLEGIDFAGCNLSGYDFSGSVLFSCTFRDAVLGDVRLVGTRTDPGALEQALDWESYQARSGGRTGYKASDDDSAIEGIGASVRKLQTIVGVQGHLRYLAEKGRVDVLALIATAAGSAPIQEAIDGLVAATGRAIEMSRESEGDGHRAVAELRSEFSHRRELIEELRLCAERAPTFALCFCCVSALTWLYQGLESRQLERAKHLLAIESTRELQEEHWKSLDAIEGNAAKFEWQFRALRKALQVDKRRPTEVHLVQLMKLAKNNDQLSRVFRLMVEREMTISNTLAIGLARRTLHDTGDRKADAERLRSSVWRTSEGGKILFRLLRTAPDKVALSLTDSFQVGMALRDVVRWPAR